MSAPWEQGWEDLYGCVQPAGIRRNKGGTCLPWVPSLCLLWLLLPGSRITLRLHVHSQGFHSNPSGQPGFAAAASLMRIKEVGDGGRLGPGRWRALGVMHSDPFLFQGPRPPFFLYPGFHKLVMLVPNACTDRQRLGWSVPCVLGLVVV